MVREGRAGIPNLSEIFLFQLTATMPPMASISRSFCRLMLANISMITSTPSPSVAVCDEVNDKNVTGLLFQTCPTDQPMS